MHTGSTQRDDRRDGKSTFVSLLLLAGLCVGGAGFFSQHYRIEFVPKGEAQGATAHVAASRAGLLPRRDMAEPEVILVDGCGLEDETSVFAHAPRRMTPRLQVKAKPKAAAPDLCAEESPGSIVKTDSAMPRLALLSTLTEFAPDMTLDLPGDLSPPALPSLSRAPPGDGLGASYIPIAAVLGGGGLMPGNGITSLPAQENSDPPRSSPTSELLTTPMPGTPADPDAPSTQPKDPGDPVTASVPEPGSLVLLAFGLLALVISRRTARG